MTYSTPEALRAALEHRLSLQSEATGIGLDRLRRRVVFERVVSRLEAANPGRWVLKGGMALEARLRDRARLTKDIDLGLRDSVDDADELHEQIVDALSHDPFGDRFVLTATPPHRLMEDGAGFLTWRTTVHAQLAGKTFGWVRLDVSPRPHELGSTERLPLPNSLAFAGITTPAIEIIDVNRHAAEKFHAMQRDFGDRDNSRVRDLVDLVILHENGLLEPSGLSAAIRNVWREREQTEPPTTLPPFPATWPARYAQLAADHELQSREYVIAVEIVTAMWIQAVIAEES